MSGQRIIRDVYETTVEIASGATDSDVLAVGQYAWGTFQLPSAFTGASITVQYSLDGTNFTDVPTEGTESNPVTVSASGTYRIPSMAFAAKFVKLVSASAEGADRTIRVHLKA